MTRKVSKNYTKNCFVLKCDIKKFFESINRDELADQFGEMKATPEIEKIVREKETLEFALLQKYCL